MNGMEKFVKIASSKLGMSQENLMSALEKGDMNSILANMKPEDKQKMKSMLEDGSAIDRIMSNPQAAAMLRQMKK
jgi:DNA-directed RNA polymerase subunit F